MSNLIARLVVFVFACLFAFGSPAAADTILITSGGLSIFGPPDLALFGSFDASGPDFSASHPSGVVLSVPCGRFGECVPGTLATIGIFSDLPITSEVTYQGITYPIGAQPPFGLPSPNAWFIDVQGTLAVPLVTGTETLALTVPMLIGGNFFVEGAQHTFTGSATAALTLGLTSDQLWRTSSFAVTVDPAASTPIPEPASMLLVGAGLGAAAWRKVRAGGGSAKQSY